MPFKVGDKVEIVKYGHLIWESKQSEYPMNFPMIFEDDNVRWLDIRPDLVGKAGIVNDELDGQYSVYDIGAWFSEEQLKLIEVKP